MTPFDRHTDAFGDAMTFKVGDRVTTDDGAGHGATILSIDHYGMATIQFDQRHDAPYPPDEVDVGDLRAFREERRDGES